MKIAYITNASVVGGWAHSVQIVNMCSAFAYNRADVTLILPYRKIFADVDVFEYYSLPRNFSVKMLPCVDIYVGSPHTFFYWLRFMSFYISAKFFVLCSSFDVLYSRDLYSTLFFSNIIIEQHSFPQKISFIHKNILSNKKIIALTRFIKNKFITIGVNEDNILVSPSGVDLTDFKTEKRIPIPNISDEDFIFGYIGTLKTMGMEKGVSIAIEALKFLPANYKLYIVGGEPQDIEFYRDFAEKKDLLSRVIFAGKVSHADIPLHIASCDVLVAPFPKNEHYSYYMSPLKIFEYMASQRPMVVTDLPSLREVLTDDETALFVSPDNPKELADAVKKLSTDSVLAQYIAHTAYVEVSEKYTWKKRAENILNFIHR